MRTRRDRPPRGLTRKAAGSVLALLTAVACAAFPAAAQVEDYEVADDSAGSSARSGGWTGYLTASYGVALAAEESYTWAWTIPVNEGGGRSASRTTYNLPDGDAFSVGGGALAGNWGVGLLATEQSHSDSADEFEFFSTSTFPDGYQGTGSTDFELERLERAVHLQAVWAPQITESVRLMVFAGPTYFFEVSQDVIDFIAIELLEPGVLKPVPFPPTTQEESAWGYHAGTDLTIYLSRSFGFGLSALYSHGTVELRDHFAEEVLTNVDVVTREQEVGGIQLAVGLRVRL